MKQKIINKKGRGSLNHIFSLGFALCFIGTPVLVAQTQVSTPVVGFSTTTIPGKVSGQSQYLTIVPVNLQKSNVFSGTGTASGSTVSPVGAMFTNGSFNPIGSLPTHYLAIVSGSGSGLTSDVLSNSTNSITTVDDLSTYLNQGARFEIVPHVKVTDLLGVSGSQVISGGANATAADNIFLVGTNGAIQTYYYKTGVGAGLKTSLNADATAQVVYPGEALMIARKTNSPTAVTLTGRVFDTNALVPITSGYNLSGGAFPIPLSLSQLTSIVSQGASPTTADNVFWVDPADGQLKSYYYKSGVGAGWKTSLNVNVSSNTVLSSGFVLLRRTNSGVNFVQNKTW